MAPAVDTALRAVVIFMLVPSPCGILRFSNGRPLHTAAHSPLPAGFYPPVKISGRYPAIPSTDKRKIDLNVILSPLGNPERRAGAHPAASSRAATPMPPAVQTEISARLPACPASRLAASPRMRAPVAAKGWP